MHTARIRNRVLTSPARSHTMPEDGIRPNGQRLTRATTLVAPMQHLEDNVLNETTIKFHNVPRLGSGGAAAWEECARRSEVTQH